MQTCHKFEKVYKSAANIILSHRQIKTMFCQKGMLGGCFPCLRWQRWICPFLPPIFSRDTITCPQRKSRHFVPSTFKLLSPTRTGLLCFLNPQLLYSCLLVCACHVCPNFGTHLRSTWDTFYFPNRFACQVKNKHALNLVSKPITTEHMLSMMFCPPSPPLPTG